LSLFEKVASIGKALALHKNLPKLAQQKTISFPEKKCFVRRASFKNYFRDKLLSILTKPSVFICAFGPFNKSHLNAAIRFSIIPTKEKRQTLPQIIFRVRIF